MTKNTKRGKVKLSALISDEISKGNIKGSIFQRMEKDDFGVAEFSDTLSFSRINFIKFVTIAIFVVFLLRLFQLTVVEGQNNRDLADNNSIKLVEIEAKRGRILDRSGAVLAYSGEKFFLEKEGVKSEISKDQASDLEREGLAGENFTGSLGRTVREVVRIYPIGEVAAHAVGYTSQVQKEDLLANPTFGPGEFVGRLGIEESYDQVLRGVNGKKIVEQDASGKTVSILDEVAPQDGQDIKLSLDVNLQKKVYETAISSLSGLDTKSGALVVSDVSSGEVLALVSLPSFDPSDVGRYITREDKPLFNRVIGGNYAPGSVFKIASALAGLESGKINGQTQIEDVGVFELGGVRFPNWYYLSYGGKDGVLKIDKAIARSNDIFFYRLGEQIGLEQMRKWALNLGFGQRTGIDLFGEAYGIVPDETWKIANLGESWFLGDTMHMAIGQGFVIVSPLQVNIATSYVANGGRKVMPHLALDVSSGGGKSISLGGDTDGEIVPSSSNLELIRSGMRQACQKDGTAWPFFDTEYAVWCKTGTAEKGLGNPHAWFTAYAADSLPQMAITVIIENGGEGSSVAAPIAKEILDWKFSKKQ